MTKKMTIDAALIDLDREYRIEKSTDNENFEKLMGIVKNDLNAFQKVYGTGFELPDYVSDAIKQYNKSHTYAGLGEVYGQIRQWTMVQSKNTNESKEENSQPKEENSRAKEKLKTFLSGLIPTIVLLIVGLILGFVVFKGEGQEIDIAFFTIESVKDILAGLGSGSVYKAIKSEPTKSSMVIGVLCIWFSVAAMIIVLFLMGYTTLFSIGRNAFWWVGATIFVVAALGLFLVVKSYDKNKDLNN